MQQALQFFRSDPKADQFLKAEVLENYSLLCKVHTKGTNSSVVAFFSSSFFPFFSSLLSLLIEFP
jgi:hypothetical protein